MMKAHTRQHAGATIQERAWPFNPTRYTSHMPDLDSQRRQLVASIDDHGFNWQVFAVAASGFLTDSYNLFASNVILPCLAFVYWSAEHEANKEITINALTLAGSAVGQVLFGFFADKYGRQRLYGIELFIVIFSTLGLAQTSRGIKNHLTGDTSMSMETWTRFWRFAMGIGIGAEYPLSATITAEWSATTSRGRMMSAVFLMQPIGQLLAWLVGLAAVTGLSRTHDFETKSPDANIGIDILWRIVIGVGAIPALIAIVFRWTIPESGRYTFDVVQDAHTAIKDTRKVYNGPPRRDSRATELHDLEDLGRSKTEQSHDTEDMPDISCMIPSTPPAAFEPAFDIVGHSPIDLDDHEQWNFPPDDDEGYSQFTYKEMRTYYIREGNWRYLAGTSLAWLLLDFAFYGLGFNNPGNMAKLWTAAPKDDAKDLPSWLLNSPYGSDGTIYQVIRTNAKECILTSVLASIAGSILIITLINRVDRRRLLIASFLALSLALLTLAILFLYLFHTPYHWTLVVFYALVQFGFAFGPNTLLFIIPAEIFPTRYRAFSYGLAAASGKVGSVLSQVVFLYFDNGLLKDPDSQALGYVIFIFAGLMAMGAVVSWAWIPSVQEREAGEKRRLTTKTLEVLGVGRSHVPDDEKIGFRAQRRNGVRKIRKELRGR